MCASIVPAAKMGYYRQPLLLRPPDVHHYRYLCRAAVPRQITLLYQDEHLLLINKPAGLLSLSGKDPRNLDSVHHRLVQRFPGCTLVHRLDFGTSGLMVIARNKGINALLCQQFSQRTVDKVYTALLCGHPGGRRGDSGGGDRQRSGPFPAHVIVRPARQTGAFTLSGH
ncbi:putative ribosomal large subunit pseudouridine synthase A [Klebsiella variicola]|uniref:Putative ribosomal large subunit pseudouridine synthase A n=1 Tax=Klebsiella variicola TaxID=244366 RepID=A0A7H4MMM0_KLEVA|nr:putative ribosomal large subunit pseudouridine synthase A [Klebsiella variicola]